MTSPFESTLAKIQEAETAMLELADDLKYPVDHNGHVLMMGYLPDIPHTLAYHLIKCGWRKDPDKALVKQRKVIGPGIPEDLVKYVPVADVDEPIYVTAPQPPEKEGWSVVPKVNELYEERSD